ncbi:CoA pyrophosphatase [uncultured Corynebacterium sp.]|uniref:NUDIX hydrolase n=1 Tax=uncultured Corynebacterium sp. TaxID=159447 RepID=UPI002594126E|nr:CoA pyrophosphatase [uncultured Corynebacterium sp.]
MTDYTQEQWLEAARQQPELPTNVPEWLRRFAEVARNGNLQETIGDAARKVPQADAQGNPPRYSAVLVLVEGDADFAPGDEPFPTDAALLLTHRAPSMREHSGQVAFPGGSREAQDAGPIDTALREAWEETGLDRASALPLAVMEPIYIDRSNFAVIPVLAYLAKPSELYPASGENDWVKMVPIAELVDPDKRFWLGFQNWRGPAFDLRGMVLWGFTGSVVTAMLEIAGWAKPWGEDTEPMGLMEALQRSENNEALSSLSESFRRAGDTGGAP